MATEYGTSWGLDIVEEKDIAAGDEHFWLVSSSPDPRGCPRPARGGPDRCTQVGSVDLSPP
jgi:hypothetical protein